MLRLVTIFVLTFFWGTPAMESLRPAPLDVPLTQFHNSVVTITLNVRRNSRRLGPYLMQPVERYFS